MKDHKQFFEIFARIVKQPVLLMDTDANIVDLNDKALELGIFDKNQLLNVDDINKLKHFLKLCSKSLSLINGGVSINGVSYKLEGARLSQQSPVVILYIYKKTTINSNFKQLNQICDLSYEVSKYKALEKKLKQQADALRKSEREILNLVNLDYLTRLVSKDYFLSIVNNSISKGDLLKQQFAILFCDLDGFKKINDIFGRKVGDILLIKIAKYFKKLLTEESIISRFGGDEFVIFIKEKAQVSNTIKLIENIQKFFSQPIDIENNKINITISIGIAVFPNDSNQADELISLAELAKDKAKLTHGNSYCYFSPKIRDSFSRFVLIEAELRKAIDNNQLYLEYQPQFDIYTDKIYGFEVLCRWNHAELGQISPAEFVAIAEQSDLIKKLTKNVFEKAFEDYNSWHSQFPQIFKDVKISLNVSALYMNDRLGFEELIQLASDSDVAPDNICFEITETALMSNTKVSIELLKKSKKSGYMHALDDFGIGYSSLSYLKNLPVNIIKIDSSFIRNMSADHNDFIIVRAIIDLATTLGFTTIAEGVETQQQKELLKQTNCRIVQGFLFAKPMPAHELIKFIRKNKETIK